MSNETLYVKNPNNDFALIQNYAIQLVAEKVLTPSAFLLYSFYQSLNGFAEIKVGFRYIQINTGISAGNITKCNKLLEDAGLIKVVAHGWKRTATIELVPNQTIPRRTLKIVPCSENESCSSDENVLSKVNTESTSYSPNEHIHRSQQDINYTKNTTTTAREKNPKKSVELDTEKTNAKANIKFNDAEAKLIDAFCTAWKLHSRSAYYTKGDYAVVKKLKDPMDALKYIEVLWCLDEIDVWVKNSDHSLSVFVKEYKSGRLQSLFPRTIYSETTMPA